MSAETTLLDRARRLIFESRRNWNERPAELRFSREAWLQFRCEVEPWLIQPLENMQYTFMGVPVSGHDQPYPIIAMPGRRQREATREDVYHVHR